MKQEMPKMPEDLALVIKKKRKKRKEKPAEKAGKEDIETAKKIMELLGDVSVYITQAVKQGWRKEDLFYLMTVMNKVAEIVKDAKMIMPELRDLEKEEAEELAGILYGYVKEIIEMATEDDEDEE